VLGVENQCRMQSQAARVRLAIPDLPLLLQSLAIRLDANGVAYVDRQRCDELLRTTQSLEFASVADAAMHLDRRQRYVLLKDCDFTGITTMQTLPELSHCVMDASFFAPLSNTKHQMTHLFSKSIPIRCQRRKFDKVTKKTQRGGREHDANFFWVHRHRVKEKFASGRVINGPKKFASIGG
jgi:hypothetical protein